MTHLVYIHGAFASAASFTRLAEKVPVHTSAYETYSVSDSLEDVIQGVSERITAEGKLTYLVAHSLGGLIAMSVAQQNPLIEGVFTMSSPFGGSRVADALRWFNSHQLYRSLNANGPVIRKVQANPPPCPVRSVITTVGNNPMMFEPNDGVVGLKSQMALDYGDKIQVPLNHFEVLMADTTVSLLKEFAFK